MLCGALVLIRQQGILIAAAFALAAAWMAVGGLQRGRPVPDMAFAGCIGLALAFGVILHALSNLTAKPNPDAPVSVGILTIQAYDIAGMIAHSKPGALNRWSGASPEVQADIRAHYSSERIDTIWRLEPVRQYLNGFSAKRYMLIWAHRIEHGPRAYVESRFDAYATLLGLGGIRGCVPAFVGIYGLPKQVDALGLRNGADARQGVIARTVQDLYGTPVFRNWFYALLLLAGSTVVAVEMRGETRIVAGAVAVAAWLYLLSFLPSTIACDVRYLYPVDALATILCVYVLAQVRWRGRNGRDATRSKPSQTA